MHKGGARRASAVLAIAMALGVAAAPADLAWAKPKPKRAAPARLHPDDEAREADRLHGESTRLLGKRKSADEAIDLAERALAIRERVLGRGHPDIAASLHHLAILYQSKGESSTATSLLRRALAVREEALGSAHPDLLPIIDNLATTYTDQLDYELAEPLLARASFIREATLGPDHLDLAASLYELGVALRLRDALDEAEALFLRVIAIREGTLGLTHVDLVEPLGSLGDIYAERGDPRAEAAFLRAVAILEEKVEPADERLVEARASAVDFYVSQGDLAAARSMYERAAAAAVAAEGGSDAAVWLAFARVELGILYGKKGDREAAITHCIEAVETIAASEDPFMLALSLQRVTPTVVELADPEDAEEFVAWALEVWEEAEIPDDDGTSHYLVGYLVHLRLERGDAEGALSLLSTHFAESLRTIDLAAMPEDAKASAVRDLKWWAFLAVSLHSKRASGASLSPSDALLTILRYKGFVLDATSASYAVLRSRAAPEDRSILDEIAGVNAHLASIALGRGGSGALRGFTAHALQEQRRALEVRLSARSGARGPSEQPVTLESVRGALPEGSALVELFLYEPCEGVDVQEGVAWGAPRYAAYVLRKTGGAAFADLGLAAPIDALARELRGALARPSSDPKPLARALDEKIMRPVRALLDGTQRIYLSPDGELHLVPFAALADEEGRYLIEHLSFTYLTSGRELLRIRRARGHAPAEPPVVVANPDYDALTAPKSAPTSASENAKKSAKKSARKSGKKSAASATKGVAGAMKGAGFAMKSASGAAGMDSRAISIELAQIKFPKLPHTAEEARAVSRRLTGARVLLGADATEAAVKSVRSPAILHLATHGFYIPHGEAPEPPQGGARAGSRAGPKYTVSIEDPLLRSGLALAGANPRSSGEDDGILTALEVSGLNLDGTRLAVLSACQTGEGEAREGAGVYGMRHALTIAGAETQVLSLWEVSDADTRDLMTGYYEKLLAGGGRSEAMRESQLALLDEPATAHPYYWAAFIVSGSDGALDGTAVAPDFAKVRRGARGCGCAAPGSDMAGSATRLFAAATGAALFFWRRRRALKA